MSEHGNDYSVETDLPDLVRRAVELADRLNFRNSCAVAYGRLLHVLAGACNGGVIGETGSGCGVGTAWMASAAPEASIFTVEVDDERAAETAKLFADLPNVTVLHGDFTELFAYGPFDLYFPDGGGKRESQAETVASLCRGGMILLDDLTPGRPGPDDVRDWWLSSSELRAIEVTLTPEHAAILAVRR